MASLRETRELLRVSHAMGLNQEYLTFSLPDKIEAECTANLRVEKHHITRLEDALKIPAVFKCDQGTVCDRTEGLCILLKRFA